MEEFSGPKMMPTMGPPMPQPMTITQMSGNRMQMQRQISRPLLPRMPPNSGGMNQQQVSVEVLLM